MRSDNPKEGGKRGKKEQRTDGTKRKKTQLKLIWNINGLNTPINSRNGQIG